MIRKIKQIKNVGRFLSYSASGDVELKRCNLIFGENGRGKTTLCAILRSLQSGDPGFVIGRKTLGAAQSPEIVVLLSDGGTAIFHDSVWTRTVPEISIFDTTFVSENVHSGDVVDIEHRRSLYSVIVGEQGVKLAKQIDDFDEKIRGINTRIREKAALLYGYGEGTDADAFVALQEDAKIDEKIAAKEKELEAIRQRAEIKVRNALSSLTLPSFPRGDLEQLLHKTVEGVAADAERRVSDKIRAHAMHDRGQAWLSEGLQYVKFNTCPFCNQSLDAAASMIGAYRDFFGKAYNDLRAEIRRVRNEIVATLDEREISRIDRTIEQNVSGAEFWSRFCDLTPPKWEGGSVEDTVYPLRSAALALIDRKTASPLDDVISDSAFGSAVAAWELMRKYSIKYNQAVTSANAIIAACKAAITSIVMGEVQRELSRLRAIKKRSEPVIRQECANYLADLAAKKQLESDKVIVREQLDRHTGEVIDRYQVTINQLLSDFQAGFTITGTRHDYRGGVPSSSYQIVINSTRVDLGDSSTPLHEPSFRNTLSAGDKSTLALAFFLAQLMHDPQRANKVVIFDDPFNSQDGFRKDCTIYKIKKCGQECAQVIVLSHDPHFLKRIWDRLYTPADRKCLEMARIGQHNTTICELDIEKETQDQYKANRNALRSYWIEGKGESRDVVQKIRPVLETYCKNLGAGLIAETDTLGTIVTKIRNAGSGHQLFSLSDDLEEVNEYTRRYHHGENPHAAIEPISDMELQGYVRRTLEMTGGC